MTKVAIANTVAGDSKEAGKELSEILRSELDGERPHALIVFASSSYNYEHLLTELDNRCQPLQMVGCSSAGEFTSDFRQVESACAIAFISEDMKFSCGIGENISEAPEAASEQLLDSFTGIEDSEYAYRCAMLLTDALAGYTDGLIEQIILSTGGQYRLFGGGAGDDGNFRSTHVFLGTKAVTNAIVGLEILSNKPVGIGVHHGWKPASDLMRVTEVDGGKLIGINAAPAVEAFENHAELTGQVFDRENPLPFFLANVIGIEDGEKYRLRVPLSVHSDGSINCAADIPQGALIKIMKTTNASAADAAEAATKMAIRQLNGNKPKAAIFFDCVATRLRIGEGFDLELDTIRKALTPAQFSGCNSYGQIARSEGQFGGFHNCTAVIGIIPE